jgi:hypothetical protein
VSAALKTEDRQVGRDSVVALARDLLAAARSISSRQLAAHRFRVGGLRIEVRFASDHLAKVYGARLGLPGEPTAARPDHRFFVLDAAEVDMERLPTWGDRQFSPRRFYEIMACAGMQAGYPPLNPTWSVLDRASGDGLLIMNGPNDLAPWDGGSPLLMLIRFALQTRGWRVAHAATLGAAGRGILLVGNGGAGKSGATLAGLRVGLATGGDDYVALGFEDDVPVARMLFRILKQDRAGLERHAGHAVATAAGKPNWQAKIEIDPQEYFPGCFAERLELRAVVVPRVRPENRVTEIVPVSAGEAMRTLMGSNLFQFGNPEEGLAFFARLLKLPCYGLALAPDPMLNGGALAHLIESLPS